MPVNQEFSVLELTAAFNKLSQVAGETRRRVVELEKQLADTGKAGSSSFSQLNNAVRSVERSLRSYGERDYGSIMARGFAKAGSEAQKAAREIELNARANELLHTKMSSSTTRYEHEVLQLRRLKQVTDELAIAKKRIDSAVKYNDVADYAVQSAAIERLTLEHHKLSAAMSQQSGIVGKIKGTFGAIPGTYGLANQATFQLASATQDAAIAFQQMGFTAQGWQMAMRGASNNLGFLALQFGTTAAIASTVALIVGPPLVSWLIDVADGSGRARRELDRLYETQKRLSSLIESTAVEEDITEKHKRVRSAGKEFIERGGYISNPSLSELENKEMNRIARGTRASIQVLNTSITEQGDVAVRERFEKDRDYPQGLPLSKLRELYKTGEKQTASFMKNRALTEKESQAIDNEIDLIEQNIRERTKNAFLEADKGKWLKEQQILNDQLAKDQARAVKAAREQVAEGAKYILNMSPSERRRADMPRVTRRQAKELKEKLIPFEGKQQGGIVGENRKPPGPQDTVPIMAAPGEEVLTKSDPRHARNLNYRKFLSDFARDRNKRNTATQVAKGDPGVVPSLRQKPTPSAHVRDASGNVIWSLEKRDLSQAKRLAAQFGMSASEVDSMVGRHSGDVSKVLSIIQETAGSGTSIGIHGPSRSVTSTQGRVRGRGGWNVSASPNIGIRSAPQAGMTGAAADDGVSRWPYSGGDTVRTWQQQLDFQAQQRQARALGRIPSRAGVGGIPGSARSGGANADRATGMSWIGNTSGSYVKRAPWEKEYKTIPDVVRPGDFGPFPTHGGSAPQRKPQQVIDDARAADAERAKKLQEDLARYHEEAWEKRKKQLQQELDHFREMQRSRRGAPFNRNQHQF